jgi:hypothetical protein
MKVFPALLAVVAGCHLIYLYRLAVGAEMDISARQENAVITLLSKELGLGG